MAREDIRAGAAYVEIYTRDQSAKGLESAKTNLKEAAAAGESLSSIALNVAEIAGIVSGIAGWGAEILEILGAIIGAISGWLEVLAVVAVVCLAIYGTFKLLFAIIGLIGKAITALATGVLYVAKVATSAMIAAGRAILTGITAAAKVAYAVIVTTIKTAIAAGVAGFNFAGNFGSKVIQPIVDAAAGVAQAISSKLKSVADWLSSLARNVAYVGAALAGISASVIAPLSQAAEKFGEAGANAKDMAVKTGLSVESVMQLGYAAKVTGASIENVADAIDHMGDRTKELKKNDTKAKSFFSALGFSKEDIAGMDLEERFLKIGAAINRLASASERAEAAEYAFGSAGKALLPFFAKGTAGLQQLRDEADRLGLVLGKEAVTTAKLLNDTYAKLKDSFIGLAIQAGQAVAPQLIEITDRTIALVTATTAWVKANQPLIAQVFRIATIVGTASTAVLTIAGGISAVAGVFSFLAGAAGSVATAITVVGGALAFLLTPFAVAAAVGTVLASVFGVLVPLVAGATSAVMAGIRAWSAFGSQIRDVAGSAITVFKNLYDWTLKLFRGIEDAIRAGSLEMAVEIAWIGIQEAWTRGMLAIAKMVPDWLVGITDALAAADWKSAIEQAWLELQVGFSKALSIAETLFKSFQGTVDATVTEVTKAWHTLISTTLNQIRTFQSFMINVATTIDTAVSTLTESMKGMARVAAYATGGLAGGIAFDKMFPASSKPVEFASKLVQELDTAINKALSTNELGNGLKSAAVKAFEAASEKVETLSTALQQKIAAGVATAQDFAAEALAKKEKEEARKQLTERERVLAEENEKLEKAYRERQAKREQDAEKQAAARKAEQEALQAQIDAIAAREAGASKERQEQLQKRLEDALKAAKKAREDAAVPAIVNEERRNKLGDALKLLPERLAGSFSANALIGLGGGSGLQEQIAKHTREAAMTLKEQQRRLESIDRNMAITANSGMTA